MLAEAVEDRIFDLVEELEILVKKNGGIENLSGDIKEEAVAMAEQTKALQIQYDDLLMVDRHNFWIWRSVNDCSCNSSVCCGRSEKQT